MDSFELPTFLSESVKYMVVEIGQKYYQKESNSLQYLTPNGTLNWESVDIVLCNSEKLNILDKSSKWFVEIIHKLWPIYAEAHSFIMNTSTKSDALLQYFEWTSEPKDVKDLFLSFVDSCVSTTDTILFLTAVIERSLGNLYMLKGTIVPSLLRDLLATSEINSILGNSPVVFLQILLGTPLALNLRNLVWHGFPTPDELYPHFASILFVIILSIDEILTSKNVDFSVIPQRSQTKYPESLFSNTFPNVKNYSDKILDLLFQHNFIPRSHQPFWKKSMNYYLQERYGHSLIILLPQFEHMLRCLFCWINGCSFRCLTAESETLYTTMNEILGKHYLDDDKQKENKLIRFLGESIMEILLDLFVYQEGPRVRDKLSHGECHIYDIPEMLVNHIFCTSVIIVTRKQTLINNKVTNEVSEDFKIENDIYLSFQQYEIKFHPLAIVKYHIKTSLTGLNAWPREIDAECHTLTNLEYQCTELTSLLNLLHGKILKNRFSDNASVLNSLLPLKVLTVLRPKSENEILKLLKTVIENVEQIVQQVKQNLDMMHHQYNMHLLRSRSRETYKRMLSVVPNLKEILFCIICIAVLILECVNIINNLPTVELEKLLKFCRVILQYVQNVFIWTKHDKNRWLEIQGITEKIAKYILNAQLHSIFPK